MVPFSFCVVGWTGMQDNDGNPFFGWKAKPHHQTQYWQNIKVLMSEKGLFFVFTSAKEVMWQPASVCLFVCQITKYQEVLKEENLIKY